MLKEDSSRTVRFIVCSALLVLVGCGRSPPPPGSEVLGTAVQTVGSAPDLTISAVSGPPSALPGSAYSASVTVCNVGTASSSATSVEVRLSLDATITPADFLTGTAPVGPLSVGQCATVSVNGTASAPQGAYYVGASSIRPTPSQSSWRPTTPGSAT